MSAPRLYPSLLAVLVTLGCSGGNPMGPGPTPTPTPGNAINVVVFYDENGDGILAPGEIARVPDVEVVLGGQSARSEQSTGRAVVRGVPDGTQMLSVRPETLPPFYVAPPPRAITVPQGNGSVNAVGLTLSIGDNQPSVYMAFGDSITTGDGAPLEASYPSRLQIKLGAHFGDALVRNRGATGTNSYEARERLMRNIRGNLPAYTLVEYGTNDWNDAPCQDHPDCYTVSNLRIVIQEIKGYRSLPFLATLIPANPSLSPRERNDWINGVNERLRVMAREEGAFLVDLNQAFMRQPSLPALFSDHIHPNAAGYEVIAQSFFEAIAHGRSTLASARDGRGAPPELLTFDRGR